MIVVTGGAGFIGSALVWYLNQKGHHDIVIIDHLGLGPKWQNLSKRDFLTIVPREESLDWLKERGNQIEVIFHMGACSATTERDADFLVRNNVMYSQFIWQLACQFNFPFVYASSAATYGSEEVNFSDEHERLPQLRPINKYGFSKHIFDRWALRQKSSPPTWYGLKFFNVYGPNEYHKGPQASVVYHAFPQVKEESQLKLFKSYRSGIDHGEQKRDFIYVKDVVKVLYHLWDNRQEAISGIYNLGTGHARSFCDLGSAAFAALGKKSRFNWIEMPEGLKNQYQYFTEADLQKLRREGKYQDIFYSLEEGVADYISNYLQSTDPYL